MGAKGRPQSQAQGQQCCCRPLILRAKRRWQGGVLLTSSIPSPAWQQEGKRGLCSGKAASVAEAPWRAPICPSDTHITSAACSCGIKFKKCVKKCLALLPFNSNYSASLDSKRFENTIWMVVQGANGTHPGPSSKAWSLPPFSLLGCRIQGCVAAK